MTAWFYDPESHFLMWGTAHVWTIVILAGVITSVYIFRDALRPYRRQIRLSAGWLLLGSRVSLDIWYVATGEWKIGTSLPFELSSIASILCAIMLLTKSRQLFEIFYFIAIGGAAQAILTPVLGFGVDQFRYMQFFLDHMLLFLAPLIMVWLYQYQVTLKSLFKSFVGLNVIAGFVFVVNRMISANYMFLMHKPSSASLLDFLGPYPFYILSLEVVALVVFFLLYLPFVGKDWQQEE